MVTVKDKKIKNCATHILTYFTTTERKEGEMSIITKYGAPDYVKKLVFKTHDDMLHDDWRYEFVHDALVLILRARRCRIARIWQEQKTSLLLSSRTLLFFAS